MGAKLGSKTSVVFFVKLGLGIPCSHKSCVGWCAQSGVKGFYALGHLRGSPLWPYEPCNILNDLLDHAQEGSVLNSTILVTLLAISPDFFFEISFDFSSAMFAAEDFPL